MADWKEKLRNFAEKQGMQVEQPAAPAQPSTFGRKPILQTRKIHADKNPKFNRMATAPYNFVPINEKVITAKPFKGFDSYNIQEAITGYVECEIEALTPVFIRGTRGQKELDENVDSKAISAFFSPTGKPCLPGSSLRGMVRSIVEMISWSRLATDRHRHYYYRGLADKSNLRNEYQSHTSSFDRKSKSPNYKMSAGYLERVGARYCITPAALIAGKPFHQIFKDETNKKPAAKSAMKFEHYEFFQDGGEFIVISGEMQGKKRDWVIHPPDPNAAKIWIPDEDVRNYNLDENRDAVNLIVELDKNKAELDKNRAKSDKIKKLVLPCFYVKWVDRFNRPRVSFGHTAMFRLAYQQSLEDLLPVAMSQFDALDMAESIFGVVAGEQILAGRVYFEDGPMMASPSSPTFKAIPEILSSPKPTTFQHYLVQTSEAIRELNHYNSEALLRGHKLYWHRRRDWQAKDLDLDREAFEKFLYEKGIELPQALQQGDKKKIKIANFPSQEQNLKDLVFEFVQHDKDSQHTVIEVLPVGSKFKAKIRFENLTKIELGALLFALALPASCCHKIGMGKPLGLGSIRITPKLYLSNRQNRYTSLRAEWSSEGLPESAEIESLKAEFANYITSQLDESERPASGNLWETYRLKQLQKMLNWDNTNAPIWNAKTRYLEIQHEERGNEYKDRLVLPIPEDVV